MLYLSESLALCLPLEMIMAARAAWNHYWCTLMKSHLFEVQALCLSSRACVRVCVSRPACICPTLCVKSPSPSLFLPAKPTTLKSHCREELEINLWGNRSLWSVRLVVQTVSGHQIYVINPQFTYKTRFLWQRTRFAIVAWPLCFDKIT